MELGTTEGFKVVGAKVGTLEGFVVGEKLILGEDVGLKLREGKPVGATVNVGFDEGFTVFI